MDEVPKKKIDESWKEQAEQEKRAPGQEAKAGPSGPATAKPEPQEERHGSGHVQARFDLFISSLAMEALVALGDVPHPATRQQRMNLEQAQYLIDVLGILEEKTAGNLSVDEGKLLKETLYRLRMRYLAKGGG